MIQSDTDHCGITLLTTEHSSEIHFDDIPWYIIKCLGGADVGQKLSKSIHHQYYTVSSPSILYYTYYILMRVYRQGNFFTITR